MYYGFDMDGSKIELGVFDTNLQRIWQKRVPIPRDDLSATAGCAEQPYPRSR